MVLQTAQGLRSQAVAASTLSQVQWAVAGGTANAITATYPVPNTSLTDGLILGFRATHSNTSTTPTFAPDGLAAAAITRSGGDALQPSDISDSLAEVLVRYNQANNHWELLNPNNDPLNWTTASGVDTITATYPNDLGALFDGLLLGFRSAGDNLTTTPTFSPNALTAHTIVRTGGGLLVPGDLGPNLAEKLLRYNLANTRWELLNPRVQTDIFYFLPGDDTNGLNGTSAQPWFPTAGGVTLLAATSYMFEGELVTSRAAGTTSHTTSLLFAGSATITAISYSVELVTGDAAGMAAANAGFFNVASASVVKGASTSATEQTAIRIRGMVRVNGAGTFIPQFQYSAAPGGAPTVKYGTYFYLNAIGSNTVSTRGAWA